MTPRWLIFVLFACCVFAARAQAQNDAPTAINGVYTGEFIRSGSVNMKLKFSIKSTDDGSLTGLFTFDLPTHPGSSVTYKLTGRYVAGAPSDYGVGASSSPFQFTTIEPMGSLALDAFDASKVQAVRVGFTGPGSINGALTGKNPRNGVYNCGFLVATRDPTDSASLDSVMAAQLRAASTVGTVASAAETAPVVRLSAMDGVYNGSYADDQGPMKFKLTITQPDDASVAGVFTFYLPEGSATNACTFEFTGHYYPAGRRFQFFGGKWETPPNWETLSASTKRLLKFGPRNQFGPGHEYTAGMDGVFDPGGGNGAGQISGRMDDPSYSRFQAIRDAAESANMANARLRNNIRPSIEGVFNGTYTRKNEPPAKFKLTMTHTRYDGAVTGVQGLAGVATIYLPTDSGTKAYTYSLTGSEEAGGQFALTVYDWETIRPKDFQNFKGMGFAGKFTPDMTHYTARIISVPTHDQFFIPTFEATWDATESADIKGTIAAQKAVRNADQVAALKARADAMKNAPPMRLASKKLVRKSQAYWNGYQGDLIRQVFDGGFADDVNDDWLFQEMFTMYVELFSKNCSANLPANHHTITIITTTYRNGYVVGKPESKTVNIDPRFIPKYCEFSGVEPNPGSPEASDLDAKNAHTFRRIMQAGSPAGRGSNGDVFARIRVGFAHAADVPRDMNKFFATETGSSAAMRQLGENLLRGATGEPSLQEAGAKIDGAEAEIDTDIPQGRFTRLIDAANIFCRDPANAKYRSRYETAFYMLLAEKYRGVMTPEEEYYYANDFAGRFRDQIMGPRANSTDPAWPRLHPAVEECMKELGR